MSIEVLIDAFRLPSQALLAHRIPKKMLVEQGAPTTADKRLINDTVDELWLHAAVHDSATEKQFAEDLEKNSAVKLYAKLPGWFTIGTPLGSYNPDWAVVVLTDDGAEKLFFVVETKGSLFDDALREAEVGKIICGGEHFAAIEASGSGATFVRATSLGDFEKRW